MNRILRYKKLIAVFFLLLISTQLLLPNTVYALTSGPSQPEMKGFEPIGTTDMVDLFSGDLTYNIPLMDVGGYPLNLAYHSGSGIDDEASWVGLGWSLNPGVINRQLRGIPDDFNGDPVVKDFNMKKNTTTGLKLVVTPEFFGFGKNKGVGIELNIGVFKNSYRGYGAELGVNATVGLTNNGAGAMTLGLNSNSQEGVNVNANVNYALEVEGNKAKDIMPGMSIGSSYNSRAGIKGLTLGASADRLGEKNGERRARQNVVSNQTSFSFAGESYTPGSPIAFNNESYTLSGSLGPAVFGIHGKIGFTGYHIKQSVANKHTTQRAYGFLHAEKGRNDINGLMDFNREKDMGYNEAIPYLPIPVATYDLFSVSNQAGSSQYRVFRNGSGIFADPKTVDKNNDFSAGVEVGAGGYFQLGVDLYAQNLVTRTNKWEDDNDYRSKGDFQAADAADPVFEPAYFKRAGEKAAIDLSYATSIQQDAATGINTSLNGEKTRALSQWKTKNGIQNITQPVKRNKRENRNHLLSYLTAGEAAAYALDKNIRSYPVNKLALQCDDEQITGINRVNASARAHHLSEITVLNDQGKRFVYGIPAYNQYQEEVSFSVNSINGNRTTGLTDYSEQDASPDNNQGRDAYFSREIMPPYAHSYLLTGMLSGDYVDKTGDGITDDDAGSAVKFNYTKLNREFHWRTPFEKGKANYNENMRSDPRDDRGSYVYGSKDIWYTHSIESKTMVALFITGDREDGLGVTDRNGGIDTTLRQRYLERIELYAKSDLKQNGDNAVPIKTVHFEYDYSSCKDVPNNSGKPVLKNGEDINALKGKLTLKKVYFTFGKNGRGILQPYKFSYRQHVDNNPVTYAHKQTDRWGTYRDRQANESGLHNDEFPYATQDRTKADAFAALWQLEEVTLPGGGAIRAAYEADDYAYVQDKRAQQMCFVKGINNTGQQTGLADARTLLVKLPTPVNSLAELKFRYFQNMTNLYFRLYVNLDNAGHYEYVPGYGTIKNISLLDSETAAVELYNVEGAHPAAIAAWQFLRMNLPLFAYPNYETADENSGFVAAIKSLVGTITQLPELLENFNSKARRQHFGDRIDLSRSWVRLCSPELSKCGGGSRVKSIRLSDNWQAMSGNGEDAVYGQDYNYTTTTSFNGEEIPISSGVAAYEPMIGNDENPFRQPFPYTKKGAPLGMNYYSYMEAPLGESFFPSPEVGYSRVTVQNIGADNSKDRTGFTVSEFYTAKDFPTIVDNLPIDPKPYKPNPLLNFLKMKFKSGVVVSQGYSIDVNDMHGKPKKEATYKKGAVSPMSSTEYVYKTENALAGKRIDNNVLMLQPDGALTDGKIGVDVDMFTDMREQYTQNIGGSLKFSFGSFPIVFFPGFYGYPGVGFNQEYREFRSASTVKLVQRSGILHKIIKIQDGAAIHTENIAWDTETGEVLLNRTQNEFGDYTYSFTYPAYWAYDGMGMAYKNIDVAVKGFSTDDEGRFLTSVPAGVLMPGDEVISLNSDQKAWVMKGAAGLQMIDKQGEFVKYTDATIKIVRSGRRNMPFVPIGALTSMNNPIKGGKIDISAFTRVIDAKAFTYKEEWPVALQNIQAGITDQPAPSLKCPLEYISGLLYAIANPALPYNRMYVSPGERMLLNEQYLFAGRQSNVTLKQIVDRHRSFGAIAGNYPLSQYFQEPFFKSTASANLRFYVNNPRYRMKCGQKYFYFNTGDTITIGPYLLILKNVHPYLNDGINGYDWVNSDGSGGYHTGNTDYYTSTDCGCEGSFGYDNNAGERVELAAHRFIDISLDATGCRVVPFCPSPMGAVVNPYTAGMLGNWRPWQQFVYHVDRQQDADPVNTVKGATDIRRSGTYTAFRPFWSYNAASMQFVIRGPAEDERWIAASEVTRYDANGQELENRDALNRYAGALFGYNNTLPVAVASNAQHHEIGFDGFEDYQFIKKCGVWPDSCSIEGHFDFRKQVWYDMEPVNTAAHTGKYSLKINKAVTVTKEIPGPFTPLAFARFDSTGHFMAAEENTYRGFYPAADRRYMASVWIKNTAVNSSTEGILQISSNTNQQPVAVSQGAGSLIEGWRKVEVLFIVPDNARTFSLTLDPKGGEAWFDDIRVHPYNSHLKSFVYNPSNQFLMAELDENNYATFYEYDDEGTLIRIKKETERGIMTLKENRSIYKKQ